MRLIRSAAILVPFLAFCPSFTSANELAGLWRAKNDFLPEYYGPLTVTEVEGNWTAEIAGTGVVGEVGDKRVVFSFPGG